MEALSKLPPESKLDIMDADIGGYDVYSYPFCLIVEGDDVISFSTGCYDAYENHQDFYNSSKLWE